MGRQTGRFNDDDETVRKRSGWLIPVSVFAVTFVLSALILLFYLAPNGPGLFEEQAAPTSRSDIVTLSVAGRPFAIPANYLIYDSARTGGERKEIALFALLPDLSGWSNWAADEFASNTAESRVAYLTIHKEQHGLKESDKLARVYLDYVADRKGGEGPYGLRQYVFRPDIGYRSEDLFVGQTAAGPVVLRCVKLTPEVPSPSCLRETLLAPGVSLSLRFKRAHLEDWQDVAAKTDKLMAAFRKPAGK
jgi:hypothetical protein